MNLLNTNPLLESIRAAYRASPMYAKIHGPQKLEPGSDDDLPLGIGRDALERELAERMNP